jgi:ribosomal protein S18 acetylase RimI-like enzyme
MAARYLKRYRMLLDFRRQSTPRAVLPEGFAWVPWAKSSVAAHAAVKFAAFRSELDVALFRSFRTPEGCHRLMSEIARQRGFLPEATWLIRQCKPFADHNFDAPYSEYCGTVQGLQHDFQQGAIQNIGICPEFRGLGLGRALLLKALSGFRQAGLLRVYLEVSAANSAAVKLYQSVGFEVVGTRYREAAAFHATPAT